MKVHPLHDYLSVQVRPGFTFLTRSLPASNRLHLGMYCISELTDGIFA
jgi:hypothetical protein